MRDGRLDQRRQRVDVEQVGALAERRIGPLRIELVGHRLRRRLRRAVVDRHVGAGAMQLFGDGAAHALRRSGHQYRFAVHRPLRKKYQRSPGF